MRKRVLILCTGNSCRSQMAEGILRSIDPDLEVYSAGTFPASTVQSRAIQVLGEIGIDIGDQKPKSVHQFVDQPIDFLITVCDDARESCPTFHGDVGTRIHCGFDDPSFATGSEEHVISEFRRVRDEIQRRLSELYTLVINPQTNERDRTPRQR
ncbi:MAG: arsenate reductase ArsC [Ignavibacteria bacterium]|nr:arsenate reductase ArsC [Ignavibacteria bacterium]